MTRTTEIAALRAESRRLFAEHLALQAEIEPRAAARETATKHAMASQRAAHEAESDAWDEVYTLREAHRISPHDLRLVAATDQAEAAYEQAREAARVAAREAAAVARAALEESIRDSERLGELGARCRAAQERLLAAAGFVAADQ